MSVISTRLDEKTRAAGYLVGFKPWRQVRGWPVQSERPFHLYLRSLDGRDWVHVASFRTAEALEANFDRRTALAGA